MQRKKLILDILARGDSSGGSRGGARVAPPPLFLDQTEARRAEKMFLGEGSLRWFPIAYIFLHLHSSNIKGGVWLHFEPKFVTDCKPHKTPAILCIFIEFFMQIDQPTV